MYWHRTLAVLVLLSGCFALPAMAEVTIHTLPKDCADFAFNHDTGDLAMVATDANEAWLIRAADLKAGKLDARLTLNVGSSPSSIFFKKFKELAVYAIVCSQDSHMYLMDASDGKLVKKIELAQSGVRNVTGSLNTADPFLYYNYGAGHDCATGAVNLRTMQNQPLAFDDSYMSAISASGNVAYRLGPWSPSGFESLIRTSGPNDDKVAFGRLFYDHDSKGGYIPDPFDRFTAVAQSIYNRDLTKREADLGFLAQCFFRKSPIVVGYERVDDFRSGREQVQSIKLRAASYNTFSAAGDVITLSVPAVPQEPRPGFNRMRTRRMFASDVSKQVIYASGASVALVPLSDFNVPEEPFLLATLSGNNQATVDQPGTFALGLADPKVEVVVENMPDGMKAQGNNFTWTPSADQIGPAKLAITLKHGTIQRSQTFDLNVVRPSVEMPFSPVDVALSSDEKRLLIWEGPVLDRFGRPTLGRNETPTSDLLRMALVDAATGKLLVERKLPEPIARVTVIGDFFCLSGANSPRCDVLRISDLERQKSVVANAPIKSVDALGDLLVLSTQEGFELYSLPKLDRLAVLANSVEAGQRPVFIGPQRTAPITSGVTPFGLLARGLLMDENQKTALILSVDGLQALPGADPNWRLTGLPNAAVPVQPNYGGFNQGGSTRLASIEIPHTKAAAQLEMRTQHRQVPGAIHTNRMEMEITLNITGDDPLRSILVKEERPSETAQSMQARPPSLSLSGRNAFVIVDRKVYRTPLPKVVADSKLAFVPKQSALALAGTGETKLAHTARGGKAPYKFNVLTSLDAIKIDEQTGVVTLSESSLLADAAKAAEQAIVRSTGPNESLVDSFRAKAPPLVSRGTEILGRKPTGYPVAIPIRVEVSDAEQATAALQYFVLAEVPSGPLTERLKKLEEERQAKLAAAPPMPAVPVEPDPIRRPGDSDVNRRLDALEQRMDNLTRQLNEVLKRLDTIKP